MHHDKSFRIHDYKLFLFNLEANIFLYLKQEEFYTDPIKKHREAILIKLHLNNNHLCTMLSLMVNFLLTVLVCIVPNSIKVCVILHYNNTKCSLFNHSDHPPSFPVSFLLGFCPKIPWCTHSNLLNKACKYIKLVCIYKFVNNDGRLVPQRFYWRKIWSE